MNVEINEAASDLFKILLDGELHSCEETIEEAEQIAASIPEEGTRAMKNQGDLGENQPLEDL